MTKRGALGRWWPRGEDARAAKQQGDVQALDREGDPRGGIQSEAYRLADPRDASARPRAPRGNGRHFFTRPMDAVALLGGVLRVLRRIGR
ncbi:MAG: hypothetical protein H0U90_08495 [Actinobacteria bacterium]|nr:hypothetical protein [Actinomycetota bacterium]